MPPCVDLWEVRFPAELDVWNGRSCMWKKQWGQCAEFLRQCQRTCGGCSPDGAAAAPLPTLAAASPPPPPVPRQLSPPPPPHKALLQPVARARTPPPRVAAPAAATAAPTERQRYVGGDGGAVVSAGSECGVPTARPAHAAGEALAMRAADASMFDADGRRYASVTYESAAALALAAGEVAQLAGEVRLPRPQEAVEGIAAYAVDVRRAARAAPVHLKRLTLAPRGGCDAAAAAAAPLIVAGDGGRGVRVDFPHPFGLLPPPDDRWAAELHTLRADGLADLAAADARQCVCARRDVGSRHCCPHGCRFAAAAAAAANYRLSITLVWLLRAPAAPAALRPLGAWWVAAGGGAAADLRGRAWHCGAADPSAFDVPRGRTRATRAGAWRTVPEAASVVVALAVPSERAATLTLWWRDPAAAAAGAIQAAESLVCAANASTAALGGGAIQRRAVPCAFASGERLGMASELRAAADLDVSEGAALGADDGFVVWVDTDVAAAPATVGLDDDSQ